MPVQTHGDKWFGAFPQVCMQNDWRCLHFAVSLSPGEQGGQQHYTPGIRNSTFWPGPGGWWSLCERAGQPAASKVLSQTMAVYSVQLPGQGVAAVTCNEPSTLAAPRVGVCPANVAVLSSSRQWFGGFCHVWLSVAAWMAPVATVAGSCGGCNQGAPSLYGYIWLNMAEGVGPGVYV